MAHAKPLETKDLTECGICLLTIEEPKALPCLHTFCLKCLAKWAQGKNDKVKCPLCNQDFPIPPEGIKGFITNFVINTLKDRREMEERLHAKDAQILCSCCGVTDSKAEAYCTYCGGFICNECGLIHRKILVFQDHKTIPYIDLQSGKVDIKSVLKQQCCREHNGQVLRFYCKTCGVLICHECTVIDHPTSSHSLVNLKHATKEQRSEVKQLMTECIQVKDMVESSLKSAEQVQNNLERSLEKAKSELHQSVGAECSQITQNEAELTQAAAVNKKQIDAQKESLLMQQTRLQTALQMATEVTQTGSDHDLALVFSSLKHNLSQLRDMEPGTVDVNLGEIKFTANPPVISATMNLPSLSIDSNENQHPVSTGVNEELCIYNNSSLSKRPLHDSGGTWTLSTRFSDKTVQTSEWGIRVREQSLRWGRHIALTSLGHLIVTDYYCEQDMVSHGQVVVYSQSGDFKYSIDTKQGLESGQTSRPWNVVVSHDGRIFITHSVSHVNVYDQCGTFKYRFPTKPPSNVSPDEQNTRLRGLAFDNQGCLLVGEVSHKYISKHRLNGSHVSTIKVTGTPGYIAVTSTDNLIVSSGLFPSSAYILDPTGNILHALDAPPDVFSWNLCGMCCTADDVIYITNCVWGRKGGGIYCYSTSGQYKECITKYVEDPGGFTLTEDGNELFVVANRDVFIFSRQESGDLSS